MPSSSDGYHHSGERTYSKQSPYQPYVPKPVKKSTIDSNSYRERNDNMTSYSLVTANGRTDDDSYKRRLHDSNASESSKHTSSTSNSNEESLPAISSLPKIGRIQRDFNAKQESDEDRITSLRLENTKLDDNIERLKELVARCENKDIEIRSKVHGTSLVTSSKYTENLKLLTDTRRRLAALEKQRSDNQYSIDRLQTSLHGESSLTTTSSSCSSNSTKKSTVSIDSVKFVTNELKNVDQPEVDDIPSVEFFDIPDHWCSQCDSFSPSIEEFLQHLQTQEHYERVPGDRERPWPMKTRPSEYDPDRKLFPMLGSQFLVPCKAFFCSICKMFLGDNEVATEHMFSLHHNKIAKSVESSRPEYKKLFDQDKAAALARRDAEERKKKRMAEEKAIEEQKKQDAAQQEELAKQAKEAAEKSRKEEAQRKAEREEAERARRFEAEKQTIASARVLSKVSKPTRPSCAKSLLQRSSPVASSETKESNKRKRSKISDAETSEMSVKGKGKKKLKSDEVVLKDCYVLISFEDQSIANELLEEAKYFKCAQHIHKFNEEDETWSKEVDPSQENDDMLLAALDDQNATDDETYVNPDPMLVSSLHDQILNALDKVVKSKNTQSSHDVSSTTDNGSFYSRETATTERPSTPSKQAIGSNVFDSSPCSIITGADVILSKQCSIDGASILSTGCSEEQIETEDCEMNLNIEIPQLNLDVLANDE